MAKNISDIEDDLLEFDDEDEVEEKPKALKKVLTVIRNILIIAVVAVAAVFGGKELIKHFSKPMGPVASKKVIGIKSLFEEKQGSYPLIADGKLSEYRVYEFEGVLYLNTRFVNEAIDCRFYADEESDAVLYTKEDDTYVFTPDVKGYKSEGGKQVDLTYKPVVKTANGYYVALDMINFGRTMFEYEVHEEPKRISVWTYAAENTYNNRRVNKKCVLREGASVTKYILMELNKDDLVTVLDDSDENFYHVFVKGVSGYVEKKYIDAKVLEHTFVVNEPYKNISKNYNISLGWMQITTKAANNGIMGIVGKTNGVNTISPTWYSVADENGNIKSLADEEVTEALQAAGYEVWPLVSDFAVKIDTEKLLKSRSARKKLIEALMDDAKDAGYDGYNIDFEAITLQAGPHYLQFLRELSVECRKAGIVLSTDNYVPMDHTAYYNREEQGKIVDYVIVMAYDEHYGGSEVAGSVASLPFVKTGIENTISQVGDSKKVIVGVPFYSRLWKEETKDGTVKVSSQAYTMVSLKKLLAQKGVTPVWKEETGQYYGEYKEGTATFKTWVEDERSIEEKMKVISSSKVAGVAFWRLGYEDSTIYNVINKYN